MERFFSILLILAMLCVPAFAEEEEEPDDVGVPVPEENIIRIKDRTDLNTVDELYCTAGTEEEALVIAECYGITFIRFDGVIAYFKNESGIPSEQLIALGMENGWVPIAVNRTITIWDERPGQVYQPIRRTTDDISMPEP